MAKKEDKYKDLQNISNNKDFIGLLENVFKDYDFDFSETHFNGWDGKTSYFCKKHGVTVNGTALQLYNGKLCGPCNGYNVAFTTEEWVNMAKELYHDIDYSEVEYVDKSTKVTLICPRHGRFQVIPRKFITGKSECPKCAKEERGKASFEKKKRKFLEKMNKAFEKYDYDLSKVEYKGPLERVEITCRKHNCTFRPLAFNIMYTNSHCPECIKEEKVPNNRKTLEGIQAYLDETFDGKIELCEGNEEPKNVDVPLKFYCHEKDDDGNEHGIFTKDFHSIKRGSVCPKCGRKRAGEKNRLTQEEFLELANKVHLGRGYDFSETVYRTGKDDIVVICPIHGKFVKKAHAFLSGEGCQKCHMSHLELEVMRFLTEHNINYIWQVHFDWLGLQSLDFYLPDYNIGIECQGYQHFFPDYYQRKYKGSAEDKFAKIVERDTKKKRLCKENNLNLIFYLKKGNLRFMDKEDTVFTECEDLLKILESATRNGDSK